MGCVYSRDRDGNERKNENIPTPNNNNGNNVVNHSSTSISNHNNNNSDRPVMLNGSMLMQRFNKPNKPKRFEVKTINIHHNEINSGYLEIHEHEMVFRFHSNPCKELRFEFRALRKYGQENDILSLEMGRKFENGPGFFCFKCANAEELYNEVDSLIKKASALTASSLPRHFDNCATIQSEQKREYENLALNSNETPDGEPIMISVVPNRANGCVGDAHHAMLAGDTQSTYSNLPHYRNLAQNITKSQPNFYTVHPTCSEENLHSLREVVPETSQDCYSFAAQTGAEQHEYVNANILEKESEQRRSLDHANTYQHPKPSTLSNGTRSAKNLEEIKRKIDVSDDLGIFGWVNIDRNGTRNNLLPRTLRTTPESTSQSYIQLDLQTDKSSKEKSETENVSNETTTSNEAASTSTVINANGNENVAPNVNDGNDVGNKSNTSVPYAQIDFAKTSALSESKANHRRL